MPESNKITSDADFKFTSGCIHHTDRMLKPVVYSYVDRYKPSSLLDIGCGNGTMVQGLALKCPTIVGMDPSESGVNDARINCPIGKFYCMGVYENPEIMVENNFDMVISLEVIEHLFYPHELLRFVLKKLKPGGILVLSTPYHGYLKNLAIALLDKWDNHHTVHWKGGHIKFWSRATLTKLLIEEGFEVIGFHGCGRVPYLWKSMILVGRKKSHEQ